MENENRRNYPYGRKEAEGFAMRGLHNINCVPGPEQPPGLLPIGPGKSSPYMPPPASAVEKPRR
jgi:hypothetical protein